MKLFNINELEKNDLALIGICSDENSSFMRGPAEAPQKIREVLHNGAANLTAENGINLSGHPSFKDTGDRDIASGVENYLNIEQHIREILDRGAMPLVLGGDHAITYPVLKAIARRHGPVNILHFDAHPDLYEEYEGNRFAHGCPFARIMEENLATRLVQIGIRTLNTHQREQGSRYGVEIHEMKDFRENEFQPDFHGPVYLSFDIDSLDPAFAPGVSHHEPGGFSVRSVLNIIHRLDVDLIGADIVEYNPARDVQDMTAMVAAKLLKEIAGNMLEGV